MSKLISQNELIYMGERNLVSKAGNDFTLITIGDRNEMQKHEFFKDNECNVSGLTVGDSVEITLNLDTQGFNQRLSITNINKTVKK